MLNSFFLNFLFKKHTFLKKLSVALSGFFFLLTLTPAQAQIPEGVLTASADRGEIIGKLVDASNDDPASFATVALTRPDSSVVSGLTADENGVFHLVNVKPGNYLIRVTNIGYQTLFLPNVNMPAEVTTTDLGVIRLSPNVQNLNEVVVRAEKTMIVSDIDKKIVNVGRDLLATSNNVSELLEKVPSVSLDENGSPMVRGKGSVVDLWGIRAGLRLTDATQKIDQISRNQAFSTHFFYLVPSFAITRKLDEETQVKVNYSRRVQRYDNVGRELAYGFETDFSKKVGEKLKLNASGRVFRSEVISLAANIDNRIWSYSGNLNAFLELPLKMRASAYVTYDGPRAIAQGTRPGVFVANLGVRRDFFERKATLSVSVQDLFLSRIYRSELSTATYVQSSLYHRTNRFAGVTFHYRFGRISASGGDDA